MGIYFHYDFIHITCYIVLFKHVIYKLYILYMKRVFFDYRKMSVICINCNYFHNDSGELCIYQRFVNCKCQNV